MSGIFMRVEESPKSECSPVIREIDTYVLT